MSASDQGSTASRPMSATEWGLLLTLAVVWGGSFFFNGVALRELPVFTVVVARVALAALILSAILFGHWPVLPARRPMRWLASSGAASVRLASHPCRRQPAN